MLHFKQKRTQKQAPSVAKKPRTMSGDDRSASDAPVVVPQLPSAAQPDLVRAQQKDDYYRKLLSESVSDAVRLVFGPQFWNDKLDAIESLGDFLYFAATTGSNSQTLGEEYTDLFTADARGDIPSASRRWALVALEALAKPIGRRLRNASRNAVSGIGSMERRGASISGRSSDRKRDGGDDKEKKRNKSEALKKQFLQVYAWMFGNAPQSATSSNPALKRVNDRGGFGPLTQLMLFYAFGKYVSWTNWATGMERVFVNPNPGEPRAKYSLLSKLIALQIAYAIFNEGQRRYRLHLSGKAAKGNRPKAAEEFGFFEADGVTRCGDRSSEERQKGSVNPVSVMDDANMLPSFGVGGGLSNDFDQANDEDAKRYTWHDIPCPLCLNPTKYPTALKCGHCLCWECAVECCQQKPECPLCRAPCKPQELITIANP